MLVELKVLVFDYIAQFFFLIFMIALFNSQLEHPETMSVGGQKTYILESPDSFVKGVTLEEFAEMKLELEHMRQQLETEKKEKEELTKMFKEEVKTLCNSALSFY